MKLLVRQSSPVPWYLVTLSPKYLAQDSSLIRPMAVFVPHCDRSSYTHAILQANLDFCVCVLIVYFPAA
jgi:hypothetical protein